jgi:hypothetical protein
LALIGNEAGHRDMGHVQQLGAFGGRRAEIAARLGQPTCGVSRTHLGSAPPPAFCNNSLTVIWGPA